MYYIDRRIPASFCDRLFAIGVMLLTSLALPQSVAAQSLPAGWSAVDVNAPTLAGTTSFVNGIFTVTGAGADIWGTSDQFRFVYQQVTGDVDVVARVASLQYVHDWTKGGVMIRGSLKASAAHAFAQVSANRGVVFQPRPVSGGSTLQTSGGTGQAPLWLKLQRRGGVISAYRSLDGTSWTYIGQQALTLPSTFYVGLAVTSHEPGSRATATFDNVTIASASTPTNQLPTVSLTSPVSGTAYIAPASLNVAATASDADGTISQVSFYAGSTLIGSDTTSPYGVAWNNVAAGTYTLTAVASDNAGATTTSVASTVNVKVNQAPLVSLTAPAAASTFVAPATVAINASASDSDGNVTRVEFYAGSTMIGSDTTSPYTATWASVPAGTYTLTAVARDNANGTTVSSARTVIVNDPALPGHAFFVPSTNHATAVDRYVLDLFPAGANPSVANPVATQDLGKPPIVNGECGADISQTVAALPVGSYIAVVTAFGPGGSAKSTASAPFTR